MTNKDIREILNKLGEHERRINTLERQIKSFKQSNQNNEEKNKSKFPLNFCERANIDENQLGHVFYYEEDNLELVCTIEGKSNVKKQFRGALIILTFYYFWKGIKKIKSQDLRKMLEEAGIESLGNLSTNLKKTDYKKYIRPDGISGSPEFSYKITEPLGIEEGLKIIRDIALNIGN